mmetsp:Transcript_389/g.724  ORF Transcript_389/g.724 Transcript_389/m.724 type:complete len:109 (+) Transcript_389:917-1243(+)
MGIPSGHDCPTFWHFQLSQTRSCFIGRRFLSSAQTVDPHVAIWVGFLSGLTMLRVLAMGFTISWNYVSNPLYQVLLVFTITLQSSFAVVVIFVWDYHSIWVLIDSVVC